MEIIFLFAFILWLIISSRDNGNVMSVGIMVFGLIMLFFIVGAVIFKFLQS